MITFLSPHLFWQWSLRIECFDEAICTNLFCCCFSYWDFGYGGTTGHI